MSRRLHRYAQQLLAQAERLEVPSRLEDKYAAYADDPVGFARDVFHVDMIPDFQADFLRDVAVTDRVAWVAGHAAGKSYAAALLLGWYLVTRPGCRCIVTSATYERQVGRVIFAKLASLVRRADDLPIEVGVTRAQISGHPEWSAEGVPATKPANFSGFHASRMLVIADESKSLERPVFEELHGVLASARDEARLVLMSTAGPATGYFYDTFNKHAELWRRHRTPSTESPFARGYAERMMEECLGPEDPVYRMRVMAEFAEDVEGQLIPLSAIYAAIGRQIEEEEDLGYTLGVDLARFGDDRSVICVRKGKSVETFIEWRKFDLMESAARVSSEINAREAKAAVDSAGLGAGVYDRLKQLGHRGVKAVNVAERSSKRLLFMNLRAELGWGLRAQFERGEISIPDNPGLVSELAALRYGYDSKGRIRLEPKDEAKARLGRSPDLADALVLAFSDDNRAKRGGARVVRFDPRGGEREGRSGPFDICLPGLW